MVRRNKQTVEYILCACGKCGLKRPKYDVNGNIRLYLRGHNDTTGHKKKQTHNYKHSKLGNKNPLWKGDKVSIIALHQWVNNHLPKPDLCQMCGNNLIYDLANVTGIYNRDFNNWKYLCRRCHMKSDGRLDKFLSYRTPLTSENAKLIRKLRKKY